MQERKVTINPNRQKPEDLKYSLNVLGIEKDWLVDASPQDLVRKFPEFNLPREWAKRWLRILKNQHGAIN